MTDKEYKLARNELNLTQSKLAKIIDVTRGTINRRENGNAVISRESELAIAYLRDCIPAKIVKPDSAVA